MNDVSVRSSCRVGRPRDAPDVDPFGDCTHDGPSTDILSVAVELSAPRPRGGWVQLNFLPSILSRGAIGWNNHKVWVVNNKMTFLFVKKVLVPDPGFALAFT